MARADRPPARRRSRRAATALVVAAAVMAVGCSSSTGNSSPPGSDAGTTSTEAASSADFAGSVDIGNGRTMYLTCHGTGSPTIVLVSGLGERADNWSMTSDPDDPARSVYEKAGAISRVCAYDRPGTGTATASGRDASRSTPVPQPSTGTAAASDLDAMLSVSGESGPYVLVGHSYGGDIIRLYAEAHPEDVAGLVLDDALSEDLTSHLTPEQAANLQALNTPDVQGLPPGAESVETEAVFRELRAITTVPDVPIVVLTADAPQLTPAVIASGQLPPFVDQAFADAVWSAQLSAQDELAAKFPGAIHITETSSTHYIQNEQPQLVLDVISQVVGEARAARPDR